MNTLLHKSYLLFALLLGLFLLSACDDEDPSDNNNNNNNNNNNPDTTDTSGNGFTPDTLSNGRVVLEGSIDQDISLDAGTRYLLRGYVYIDSTYSITIPAGTIIYGDKATDGTLVIRRGAQIFAEGTAQNPIIFTSEEAIGDRRSGDWGGVIIAGNAPVNEPGEPEVEGGTGAIFGGNDPNDNSGVLRYVRIEFPGIALFPNQEINGLTLAGVGSATTVDYVQVSHSGDDAFEFFGGTVNAKHLVSYYTLDDDFDTDLGYSGKVQFGVCLRVPTLADNSTSNAFESDGHPSGQNLQPFTNGVFSNISCFGPIPTPGSGNYNNFFRYGALLRRRSRLNIYNTLFAGWPTGLRLESSVTTGPAEDGTTQFRNNFLAGNDALASTNVSAFDSEAWVNDSSYNNTVLPDYSTLGLGDPFNLTNPDFLVSGGSALRGAASFNYSYLNDPFFEQVSYVGAFGDTDWTAGWTNFDPVNTNYE